MNYRKYTTRNLKQSGLRIFFNSLSITNWLILINILVFIATLLILLITKNENIFNYVGVRPSSVLQGKYIWTVFTSMFMHGGFWHILVNMFVLFSLGNLCEKIIGRKRFFLFYLISGIVSSLFFVLLAGLLGTSPFGMRLFGSPDVIAVGASGAIFGIAGLFVIILPKIRFSIIFFPFFSLPGYIMIPSVLILFWFLSFISPETFPFGNTAHFGGLVAGIVYGLYLRKKYKRKVQLLGRMFR